MPRLSANEPQAPVCQTCGREMMLMAILPSIGDRPCVRVYKCLPCGRIELIYENYVTGRYQHGPPEQQ